MQRGDIDSIKKVAIIGTYLPRRCGIATFSSDLFTALSNRYPTTEFAVVAMDDGGGELSYPNEVRWHIRQDVVSDYWNIGQLLMASGVDRVLLQHEFGIFGGDSGAHIVALLRQLTVPVVTTFHTVLRSPSESQRQVLDEVIELSSRVVVMSKQGVDILREVHGVPPWKIEHIPHGVHDLPADANTNLEHLIHKPGARLLLTFGLVSPDKGIESVIEAMPDIVDADPRSIYFVAGATHPNIKASQGERYRDSLFELAERLHVSEHVIFHDEFLSLQELGWLLHRADVYITPYRKREQITSGTLAYAMGAGSAIISTPYWYAEEMLSNARGQLVPFEDPKALSTAAISLLRDGLRRTTMAARAKAYARSMRWDLVGARYMETLAAAAPKFAVVSTREEVFAPNSESNRLRLNHLAAMTDDVGLIQHATYDIPNMDEGYCVDDNARGLILTTDLIRQLGSPSEQLHRLFNRYQSFVSQAFNPSVGRFRNFMSYGRMWLEEYGSEDSHGRAVWALGHLAGSPPSPVVGSRAEALLREALPAMRRFTSPRAWAYGLLGITSALKGLPEDPRLLTDCEFHAARLDQLFTASRKAGWPWFEDRLTYCNARLPQALLVAGERLGRSDLVSHAIEALSWLSDIQIGPHGCFEPVGCHRPFIRGGSKPRFDQQPVDVVSSVCAYLDAARITRQLDWIERARFAYRWFLGDNHLGEPVFDAETGAGFDGLAADRVNLNRGAESTLSFLQASLAIRNVRRVEQMGLAHLH